MVSSRVQRLHVLNSNNGTVPRTSPWRNAGARALSTGSGGGGEQLEQTDAILKGYMKDFYLLVHPDFFGESPASAASNTKALAGLNAAWAFAKKHPEGEGVSSFNVPPAQRLAFTRRTNVLWDDAFGEPPAEEMECAVQVDLPSAVRRRWNLDRYVQRCVLELLQAARLPMDGGDVELLSTVLEGEAAMKRSERRKKHEARKSRQQFVEDVTLEALRQFEAEYGPLGGAAGDDGVPDDFCKPEELVVRNMITSGRLRVSKKLSKEQARTGLENLSRLVHKHYEELMCYQWEQPLNMRIMLCEDLEVRPAFVRVPFWIRNWRHLHPAVVLFGEERKKVRR